MQKRVAVFFLTSLFLLTVPSNRALAATTTMSLSPQSGSFGKPFTVALVIDGHGDKFNAAQATVTLSSNLAIQNLVLGDCNFSFLKTPTVQAPSFAGVILSGSATKCTVYTLTLAPVAKGSGSISLTKASVRRYGDAANILTSAKNGSYILTNAVKVSPVLGTQTQDSAKNGLYTLILKLSSSQETPMNNATVILNPVTKKQPQKATTDATRTVRFTNLQPGIYDATIEENNTKVGESIINVSGQNHVLTLGINLKDQQKNPLLKSENPLLKTFDTAPLLLVGILVTGVIVGGIVAFLIVKLKGQKNRTAS